MAAMSIYGKTLKKKTSSADYDENCNIPSFFSVQSRLFLCEEKKKRLLLFPFSDFKAVDQ